MHVYILSIVTIDALMLMYQAINTHNADQLFIVSDRFAIKDIKYT